MPLPLRQTFHYQVPPALDRQAVPGARVLVSFRRRKLVGYVVARDTPPPAGVALAPLLEVLDEAPTFTPPLLRLVDWMAGYYLAPVGEVLRGAHPPGTNEKGIAALRLTDAGRAAEAEGAAGALLAALLPHAGPVALDALPVRPADALVRRLAEGGLVERLELVAPPAVTVSTVRGFRAVAPPPATPRGPGGKPLRRDEIHAWLVGRGVVPSTEVRARFGNAAQHVRQLVAEGALVEEAVEVLRDPFFGEVVSRDTPPALNAAQRRAVDAIAGAQGYAGFLLHGVTGSGKTEVYLRAIEARLVMGQGALVLVPEIALTPQLVRRFRARLGNDIAVLHSGLSRGARFDQWRRLHRGEVKVAIGARSGIFAPVRDLGLIVVDEEHDPSFKQQDGVRYHARDMALLRGHQEGAAVVLGSATPSLESTWNVQQGKLARLVLAERPTGGVLPTVELVDLRGERPIDDAPFLSRRLRDALAETLARREQSILFLNRRGFSNFVICKRCGHTLECEQCAITFTWHRQRRQLRCHYCDAARAFPPSCPACGGGPLDLPGRGTERVEEALGRLFPQARVERMDRDTAGGRRLLELVSAMREGSIDVLVGTQMVTKGHDFPGVTLVGVLDADASLRFPDFRAAERTFQLLTQVAGRAGRGARRGRVLVQTYDPEDPCLVAVRAHDHALFAARELELRRLQSYPPFSHAAAVRVDGREPAQVEQVARRLAERLVRAGANTGGTRLRGPAAASIPLLRGRTRWALLLTAARRAPLHALLTRVVAEQDSEVIGDVRITVDVDAYDFS